VSVNDCFKPVSRYWDRIERPEQIITALPEAMRVLTSPADTGAVTLALPQDVQPEAFDYPDRLFEKRVWTIPRPRGDAAVFARAAEWIRSARQPLVVAGGGVIYSEATDALASLAERTGIPVAETQAGKGSLRYDHAQSLGALGVTGTPGANILAREADLVIGVGTRYSDHHRLRGCLPESPRPLRQRQRRSSTPTSTRGAARRRREGRTEDAAAPRVRVGRREARAPPMGVDLEVERSTARHGPPISQGEVIGVVNEVSGPRDVVVNAAGSMPGDLHKLWRTRDPKGYHLEYGYSTMGYEIAGGMGVKMAAPDREVYVLVGDGSYLMMAQEIATAVAEGIKLNIVVVDNHGFSSIGGLSQACGTAGFGTQYRYRDSGSLSGDVAPVDFVANAKSLGAQAVRARTREELRDALRAMHGHERTSVVVVETDIECRVPGYESWWDVPIAEVSEVPAVRKAREAYEAARRKERHHL
jgi:3D-(3,5/4)-trihydroxycyclohexane-1,2-dione acylhydrolase (decyclizing)